MAKVSLPLKGSCHCGSVRYEISAPPLSVLACHCTNCQKISGSAFAMSVVIREDDISFSGGEKGYLKWEADSGNFRYGEFCKACGCRLVHGSVPSTGMLVLRGGTLDDTSWLQPVAHIWTDSAQPWFKFSEEDVTCPGQPENPADFIAPFVALGLFAD